jgi:hypothetical protein
MTGALRVLMPFTEFFVESDQKRFATWGQAEAQPSTG